MRNFIFDMRDVEFLHSETIGTFWVSLHKGRIPVNLGWSRSNHLIQSDKLYYILHIRIMVSVSRSRNTLEYLFKPTKSFKSPYKTIKTFKILIPCKLQSCNFVLNQNKDHNLLLYFILRIPSVYRLSQSDG